MTDHNLPPHVARIYDEWQDRNGDENPDSNACLGILFALLMVAVIAALVTFAMWLWVA